MSKICIAVHRAISDFKLHVEAALPPGASIKELSVHLLTDNFSVSPLHSQHNNSEVIRPFLLDYWNWILAGKSSGSPLFDRNGLIQTEIDNRLVAYEACYPQAASAIMSSSGIDDSSFRHQWYTRFKRTVFMLKNSILSFANPLSFNWKYVVHLTLIEKQLDVAVQLACLLMEMRGTLWRLWKRFSLLIRSFF